MLKLIKWLIIFIVVIIIIVGLMTPPIATSDKASYGTKKVKQIGIDKAMKGDIKDIEATLNLSIFTFHDFEQSEQIFQKLIKKGHKNKVLEVLKKFSSFNEFSKDKKLAIAYKTALENNNSLAQAIDSYQKNKTQVTNIK